MRNFANLLMTLLLIGFCVVQQFRINTVERELLASQEQIATAMKSIISTLQSQNNSIVSLGSAVDSHTRSIKTLAGIR
jgi:cytochrome c-type biogenesis protein CcmH/NrfF